MEWVRTNEASIMMSIRGVVDVRMTEDADLVGKVLNIPSYSMKEPSEGWPAYDPRVITVSGL
jgi:hypothetical protein